MGEENCVEDPDQEGYRSLGKMLQGSIRDTVGASALSQRGAGIDFRDQY